MGPEPFAGSILNLLKKKGIRRPEKIDDTIAAIIAIPITIESVKLL